MDRARYIVGVMMIVSVPISIGLWYAIHPFARRWRRVGPVWTYAMLAVPAFAVGWSLWRARDRLIGADLGTSPVLLALVVPSVVVGIAIARLRRRQLNTRVLSGIPELSKTDPGRLLTQGIYARVRNPRYLEFWTFVLAYVAFANHVGTWVLYALTFPALHLVVLFEERELRDRFGAAYDDNCRRVPRYLPRRQRATADVS